jgi:hypothetical protein
MIASAPGTVVHVFGFQSDIERLDVLYTSLLLQMASGLARQRPASYYDARHIRAWRRSWMLGFITGALGRVRAAEDRAKADAEKQAPGGAPGVALVLADRSLQVQAAVRQAYPETRAIRMTYSGRGYADGLAKGQQADIGGTSVGGRTAGELT